MCVLCVLCACFWLGLSCFAWMWFNVFAVVCYVVCLFELLLLCCCCVVVVAIISLAFAVACDVSYVLLVCVVLFVWPCFLLFCLLVLLLFYVFFYVLRCLVCKCMLR